MKNSNKENAAEPCEQKKKKKGKVFIPSKYNKSL